MFEDDDMRLVFFQDFGEPSRFTPNAADPFTINGIFDQRPTWSATAIKGAQVGFDEGARCTGNGPAIPLPHLRRRRQGEGRPLHRHIRGREYNVFVKPARSPGHVAPHSQGGINAPAAHHS
jgi:hypothetical protein